MKRMFPREAGIKHLTTPFTEMYLEGSKNFKRQNPHVSCGTIIFSANMPSVCPRVLTPQCISSARTDAVVRLRPLLALGLYASSKREPRNKSNGGSL